MTQVLDPAPPPPLVGGPRPPGFGVDRVFRVLALLAGLFVLVVLVSWLFLKETITPVQIGGIGLIIVGVFMVAR